MVSFFLSLLLLTWSQRFGTDVDTTDSYRLLGRFGLGIFGAFGVFGVFGRLCSLGSTPRACFGLIIGEGMPKGVRIC